ncbi:AbrB/SpoV domain-containing protein (plasmid) [Rhizobium sp. NXC14]|uniref:antitoxin n=1 Tax=Rhizobium sp. NXC14 TaxID=1981173 RepID=UPI000A20B88F|nr:type II toxin-antitoxin system VapB family antitoxin [Rhizobium sp. NXC14]ARO33774.1 AbrB/SpoV domain-containing protein [Rhizobium sp. NXC14]
MLTTKVFRNGNSQAVRIPADLAYSQTEMELQIERIGDELRIRPLKPSLEGVLARFARFDDSFMAEGRGDQEQAERDRAWRSMQPSGGDVKAG